MLPHATVSQHLQTLCGGEYLRLKCLVLGRSAVQYLAWGRRAEQCASKMDDGEVD